MKEILKIIKELVMENIIKMMLYMKEDSLITKKKEMEHINLKEVQNSVECIINLILKKLRFQNDLQEGKGISFNW